MLVARLMPNFGRILTSLLGTAQWSVRLLPFEALFKNNNSLALRGEELPSREDKCRQNSPVGVWNCMFILYRTFLYREGKISAWVTVVALQFLLGI